MEKYPKDKKIDISKAFSEETWDIIDQAYHSAAKYEHKEVLPIDWLVTLVFKSNKVNYIFNRLELDYEDLGKA